MGSFHKEMGTYLETRSIERRPSRKKEKKNVTKRFKDFFTPPKLSIQDITSDAVHVFDREKAPVVGWLRRKFVKEKVEIEDIDQELVEKTLRDGRV